MLRHPLRSLVALLTALTVAHAAPARAADGWRASVDDALMFEVRSGQYRLGEGVRGYATPTGPCVDLADTLLALDLSIRVDKQLRRATGWAFDESRTIVIDRDAGTEQIKNNSGVLGANDVRDTPEGWCVAAPALARWLGVGITADTGNALLVVKSERKLPAEAAAERRLRAGNARPAATFDLASLPHARVVTRGFSTPSVDVIASVGGVRDRWMGSRGDAQYEAFVAGEIGPVAYNARLASDRRGRPTSLRLQAHRTDPKARLLGPLHATTVAVGDVSGLSTALVAQSSAGRGAFVTNRPVERRDRFDKIDLRGDLPGGWDAELYRNGQLLSFAQPRSDGRYEFLDVPLQYGPNRLEVVLYGPQGQVRREVRQVPVGLDSIPPRHSYYWAGIYEDGRDLFELDRGIDQNRRRNWRGSIGLERGIDVRTSIGLAAHSLVLAEVGRRDFVEASLRRALGNALLETSGSASLGGGMAARISAVGELGRTHYSAETIWAVGFESDRIERDTTGLHSIALDHVFGSGRGAVPVSIQARMTQRRTGNDTIDAAARVSSSIGRIAVTGELVLRHERRLGQPSVRQVDAALLAHGRIGGVRLRGEARMRVAAEPRLQSLALVGEWAGRGDDTSWRAELGYESGAGRVRAGLGYIRRFERFALNASLEAASDGAVGAGLSIAFSLGRDPQHGGLRMSSEKLASRGSAVVRVFRDANANGLRDPGEAVEPTVGLTVSHAAAPRLTDRDGRATVDGLEPYRPVLIGIDATTLADPMVQPAIAGIVVTPRPGIVAEVELALVATGDIDGTLVRAGGAPIEGVDLELIDSDGRTAARTRSEFDGFFLFERVPHGAYTLRIAPLVADALKLDALLAPRPVVGARTPSVHLGAVEVRVRATIAAN